MTLKTITAEREVQLLKRSPLNPLRRLFRQPLPTYAAPLFAEALIFAAREEDMPTLHIEDRGTGRFSLAMVAKEGATFTATRVTLRERGTGGGYFPTPPVERRTKADHQLREAGQALGKSVGLFFEGMAQGGVVKPTTVLAGAECGPQSFIRLGDGKVRAGAMKDRVDPNATDAEKYAWAGLDPATAPDGPTLTGTTPGTVLLDGLDATTPPTPTTSVLHDLQHVAGLLETAQFEIAMSPGGDAAGTSGNSAWKALCAVQTVQAKLTVMADAADLAAQEVGDGLRRAEATRPDIDTGVKRNLKRAASMLRMVTDRLPNPAKDV